MTRDYQQSMRYDPRAVDIFSQRARQVLRDLFQPNIRNINAIIHVISDEITERRGDRDTIISHERPLRGLPKIGDLGRPAPFAFDSVASLAALSQSGLKKVKLSSSPDPVARAPHPSNS